MLVLISFIKKGRGIKPLAFSSKILVLGRGILLQILVLDQGTVLDLGIVPDQGIVLDLQTLVRSSPVQAALVPRVVFLD